MLNGAILLLLGSGLSKASFGPQTGTSKYLKVTKISQYRGGTTTLEHEAPKKKGVVLIFLHLK